jgi:hypothetical protein
MQCVLSSCARFIGAQGDDGGGCAEENGVLYIGIRHDKKDGINRLRASTSEFCVKDQFIPGGINEYGTFTLVKTKP